MLPNPVRRRALHGVLPVAGALVAAFALQTNALTEEPAATPAISPVLPLAVQASPAMPIPESSPAPADAKVENSVVKVFATVRYPDLYKPWTKDAPKDITGSGVVIDGRRILTNAHVVLYASQIQIQANQAGDKLGATVEAVAPGIDLAVLKLDEPSFFDTHPPVALAARLPGIKDGVMVYGYPEGGSSLSITKGIVSRIEFVPYNGSVSGLRIQIDAAINPGNSGGPAVAGDEIIGLAFSHLGGAENIGYIIPVEEIELFLQDIADGHYDGKPAMFDRYQTLENPALRAFLKLDKSVSGVVIHQPESDAPDYPLKEWDVVTKIGDTPIDDQGMVRLDNGLRVRFVYRVQSLARDGKVPLTLVRAGQEMTVELPVPAHRPMLLPDGRDGSYPPYFVYGPLVFSEGTGSFIGGLLGGHANMAGMLAYLANPILTRCGDEQAFPNERLVVVSSPFFPHKLAKGYSSQFPNVLERVNGTKIKNLADLVTTLRHCHDEFVRFEFAGQGGETPVFPRSEMESSTEDILTDNGVRSQGSAEMMAIWKKE